MENGQWEMANGQCFGAMPALIEPATMPLTHSLNEALLQRMPLPLAQLTRRSANAKTARDQLDAAYCLWEAGLKLLASVALVEYADRSELHNAARSEEHTSELQSHSFI